LQVQSLHLFNKLCECVHWLLRSLKPNSPTPGGRSVEMITFCASLPAIFMEKNGKVVLVPDCAVGHVSTYELDRILKSANNLYGSIYFQKGATACE
jgi:hypothetical protein